MNRSFGSYIESVAILGQVYLAETNPIRKDAIQDCMDVLAQAMRESVLGFEEWAEQTSLLDITDMADPKDGVH